MLYFRPQSCLLHLPGQNWVGIDIKTHLQQTRISLNTMKEQVNNLKSIPTPSHIFHFMKIYYVNSNSCYLYAAHRLLEHYWLRIFHIWLSTWPCGVEVECWPAKSVTGVRIPLLLMQVLPIFFLHAANTLP